MIFYLYFPHLLYDFGEIQYSVSTKFLRGSNSTWYEYLPAQAATLCSTSDLAPTATHYTAKRRRSSSLGFTSTCVPRQEISGKMDWQKKPNPLAPSFPEQNTAGFLHVGLRQEHCLPFTSYRN